MILLAPHLTTFLTERLSQELGVSDHTRDAYSYTFMLLLDYVSKQRKMAPSDLPLKAIDAKTVLSFLKHIETERNNSVRSRNARLAAIRSFARYLEHKVPTAIEQVRCLLAIPSKRCHHKVVTYLTQAEIQSLLDAPNPRTIDGIRDRAMLHLAFSGGLRVSELINIKLADLNLQGSPTVHVVGKGRKERLLPLWKETTTAIRLWLKHRRSERCEVFLSARGEPLTRAGFAHILAKHTSAASQKAPSIAKKRVSPHVLRHSCAMNTLEATGDIRKVALWLGHATVQSTEVYLRTDPAEKLEAIRNMVPPKLRSGRFRAPDRLLASLKPVPNYAKLERHKT